MYKAHSHSQGYSLVEVLVAISILLIAIVGPMTIASKGLQNAQFARQQTAAVFLAQEGIEHVVRLREEDGLTHIAAGNTWQWVDHSDLNDCKNADRKCGISQDSNGDLDFEDCSDSGGTACLLYRDVSRDINVYSHDSSGGAEPTIYTRKIFIEEDSSDAYVWVTSEVSWNATAFGAERTVSVEAFLYDIYDI